jgi:hypothetical protein
MIRAILSGFILFFFTFSVYSQSKKEKKAIKTWGIKSVTEMVTENVNGKEIIRKDSYTTYDKNGDITYNEEYRKDGTLKHKESEKYDSKGNKLEETVFDIAEARSEKNIKKTYKYDSEENKIEENEFDENGKLLKKTQYTYNSTGEKVSEVEYNGLGKVSKKTVYAYDSKGLKAIKKEYDANNQVLSTKTYQYEF